MVVYESLRTCPGSTFRFHVPPTLLPRRLQLHAVSPQAQYFTIIDALCGYRQIPLAEEDQPLTTLALCGYWQIPLADEDQPLTTFITSYGRFRYL